MTVIVHESDADLDALRGQRLAVVGYGNQGRPWALNLRDGGLDVTVCVRADATREQRRSRTASRPPTSMGRRARTWCACWCPTTPSRICRSSHAPMRW